MKNQRIIHPSFRLAFVLITFLWSLSWTHAQDWPENEVCSFTVGGSSPYAGTYVVEADEDGAFAYDDVENEQFVIEINGNNDISIMLILEDLAEGKHVFSMEMQVSIDLSKDGGENYINLSNYKEEGGGYIQIDEIDEDNARLSGGFAGTFQGDTTPEGEIVEVSGTFHVRLE